MHGEPVGRGHCDGPFTPLGTGQVERIGPSVHHRVGQHQQIGRESQHLSRTDLGSQSTGNGLDQFEETRLQGHAGIQGQPALHDGSCVTHPVGFQHQSLYLAVGHSGQVRAADPAGQQGLDIRVAEFGVGGDL